MSNGCIVDGCDGKHKAKGLCRKHYLINYYKNIKEKCKVVECENNIMTKEYCARHYKQFYRTGEIMPFTKFDRNEIILKKNHAEIILRNINHDIVGKSLIDLEDVVKTNKYKWHLDSVGYVSNSGHIKKNIKSIRLHNFLLRKKGIDHISRNRLDNRRNNLRKASSSLNSFNKKIQSNNTSGCCGVHKNKWENSGFVAIIQVNYKTIRVGNFQNFNDAVKARKEAELKYFGEIIVR